MGQPKQKAARGATNVSNEPWIDAAAAREHLSISAPTLSRWVKKDLIPYGRTPGGELRFRRSELDAAMAVQSP